MYANHIHRAPSLYFRYTAAVAMAISLTSATACSDETVSATGGEEDTGGECLPEEDLSPCICDDSLAWACQCFYDFPEGEDFWGEPELCSDDPDPGEVGYVCGDDVEDAYLACGA